LQSWSKTDRILGIPLQKSVEADTSHIHKFTYGNDMVALGCEDGLGPTIKWYIPSESRRPGGEHRMRIRITHLGFLPARNRAAKIPAGLLTHMSQALHFCKAAIDHCDMPIEAGRQNFTPFSQRYGCRLS